MEHIAIAEEYERRGLLARHDALNHTAFHADVTLGAGYSAVLNLVLGGYERDPAGYQPRKDEVPYARLTVAVWHGREELAKTLPPEVNWMAARALRELGKPDSAGLLRTDRADPQVLERLLAALAGERVVQPARPQPRQDIGLISAAPR